MAAHTQWSEFQKFKAHSSRAQYIQSPYKALFHEITRIMYQAGQRWNNPNSVDFIFDEQGEIGHEAASWYLELKEA
jgi:DNA-binding ferritin-like protein (Dps family)